MSGFCPRDMFHFHEDLHSDIHIAEECGPSNLEPDILKELVSFLPCQREAASFDTIHPERPLLMQDWTAIRRQLSKDFISWICRECSKCCLWLLTHGFIDVCYRNCAGESLYFLACKQGDSVLQRWILDQLPTDRLFDRVWLTDKESGPSYLQAVTGSMVDFLLVWGRIREHWTSKAFSHLGETELRNISRYVTIELANDLLCKGINIDKATGDLSRSIWHLIIEKKREDLHSLLDWLGKNSSKDPGIPDESGKTALIYAIEMDHFDAVQWFCQNSVIKPIPRPAQMTAIERAARRQTRQSIHIFDTIIRSAGVESDSKLLEASMFHVTEGVSDKFDKLRAEKCRRQKHIGTMIVPVICSQRFKESLSIANAKIGIVQPLLDYHFRHLCS